MKVVSNASPLINLAWIGRLELLSQLFNELYIPEAVWQEVVVDGAGQPGSLEIKNSTWINVQKPANHELVHSLRQDLDAGEAEAITLAIELRSELLLMDERLGRESAGYFGIRVVGVSGILIEAKNRGLIESIKTALDALQKIAGFYVDPILYDKVLRQQGEI